MSGNKVDRTGRGSMSSLHAKNATAQCVFVAILCTHRYNHLLHAIQLLYHHDPHAPLPPPRFIFSSCPFLFIHHLLVHGMLLRTRLSGIPMPARRLSPHPRLNIHRLPIIHIRLLLLLLLLLRCVLVSPVHPRLLHPGPLSRHHDVSVPPCAGRRNRMIQRRHISRASAIVIRPRTPGRRCDPRDRRPVRRGRRREQLGRLKEVRVSVPVSAVGVLRHGARCRSRVAVEVAVFRFRGGQERRGDVVCRCRRRSGLFARWWLGRAHVAVRRENIRSRLADAQYVSHLHAAFDSRISR